MTVVLWVLAVYAPWTLFAFAAYVGLRALIGGFAAPDRPRYRLGLARRRRKTRRSRAQTKRIRRAVVRRMQRGVGL